VSGGSGTPRTPYGLTSNRPSGCISTTLAGASRWRGRYADAIAAFRAARQLAETLVTPHTLATPMRAHTLQALVLLGETGRVERSLAELDPREREGGEMRNAIALLRLVQHDPLGATAALAPGLDGSVRVHPVWVVAAALLEAIPPPPGAR